MKRKTAKEILADSFRELAEKSNIDKITVNDITQNCGYSPATFYRNFTDKYDLISWDYARALKNILLSVAEDDHPPYAVFMAAAKYVEENRKYLAGLLKYTKGQDAFSRNMLNMSTRLFTARIQKVTKSAKTDRHIELQIMFYCSGVVAMTCDSILKRIDASPEEIVQVFTEGVPSSLRPYLVKTSEEMRELEDNLS